jgi:nitrous oxidase accessory protein NosD
MRKIRLLVAATCAAVAVVAATAGSAQAATIVVNPGQSIQAAVDSANPGDTVLVTPGTYRQQVVIQKNFIRLQGTMAAILPPPSLTSPCGPIGICVVGDVDFGTGEILSYVHGVTVTGFSVSGFEDSGILALAADRATFTNNRSTDNGAYGLVAFGSIGTTMAGNMARHNGEAGLYIGDSPTANASLHDNSSLDNQFGILFRDAGGGTISHNGISHNCAGIFVLADAPGPAGAVTIESNTVNGNTAACDSEDAGPVSGAGIVLAGADHVLVHANIVEFNNPSSFTFFQGGIVVTSGPGGTPAEFNTIAGNTVLHNTPDLYWDGLGHGNAWRFNTCQTSIPHGLCS